MDTVPQTGNRAVEKLAEGMVIALEPKLVFPGKGVVGPEDNCLITASGAERLTLTEQVLMKIGS